MSTSMSPPNSEKLVIALDVGTTYSGIAYSVHRSGEEPTICSVTRYPKQALQNSKVPSILWYTKAGEFRDAGCQRRRYTPRERRELVQVEWFKLLLRPTSLPADPLLEPPTLPQGKTIIDVLADYLRYLNDCARTAIEGHLGKGVLDSRIEFVLSHPNGWETSQQSQMREAAIRGGLVPRYLADDRVHFITEGEASLLYCLHFNRKVLLNDAKSGDAVMVIDAGGGTIDISSYTFKNVSPMSVAEIPTPTCLYQGSVLVSQRACSYIQNKLAESEYSGASTLTKIMHKFEEVKNEFDDPDVPYYVEFSGSVDHNDMSLGIEDGNLVLAGSEIAPFFEPCLASVNDAARAHIDAARKEGRPITRAFLVGGFANSPWIHKQLRDTLALQDVILSRPEDNPNKAAAIGATLSQSEIYRITSRIAKVTYGMQCNVTFDPKQSTHRDRKSKGLVFTRPASGRQALGNYFDVILPQGTRVTAEAEFRRTYLYEAQTEDHPSWRQFSNDILCYRGGEAGDACNWTDLNPENFSILGTVRADASSVPKERCSRKDGAGVYYKLSFDVILLFGLTEIKAQICWKEQDKEKRGPACIVYDNDTVAPAMHPPSQQPVIEVPVKVQELDADAWALRFLRIF